MNAEILLAHYPRIADAPDAIARLRRFILDLAVRGKLVAQENDEPASELLKRIAKEKARLVKASEIRTPKPRSIRLSGATSSRARIATTTSTTLIRWRRGSNEPIATATCPTFFRRPSHRQKRRPPKSKVGFLALARGPSGSLIERSRRLADCTREW